MYTLQYLVQITYFKHFTGWVVHDKAQSRFQISIPTQLHVCVCVGGGGGLTN